MAKTDATKGTANVVPYTGATSDVNLGSKNLTTNGNVNAANLPSKGLMLAVLKGFATQF